MIKFTGLSRSAGQDKLGAAVKAQPLLDVAVLPILAVRFAGHLPYFKFGSQLILPQGLSFAAAGITALVSSVLCLALARVVSHRRWASPAAGALVSSVLLLGIMMVIGPLVSLLLPLPAKLPAPEIAWAKLLTPYLGLLIPICIAFFAAQMISGTSSVRALKGERVRKW